MLGVQYRRNIELTNLFHAGALATNGLSLAGILEQEEEREVSWDHEDNQVQGEELAFQELLAFYGYEAADPISDREEEHKGSDSSQPHNSEDQELPAVQDFPESEQMPPDWSPDLSPCSADSPEDQMLEPEMEEEETLFGSQARLPYMRYTRGRDYEERDQLLWDPNVLPECEVEVYLSQVAERQRASGAGSSNDGGLVRDNEQALYELVKCRFHTEEALRRLSFNVKVVQDGVFGWSEEERRNFEHGFRAHGKNFHLIQANKVRTRSVGECVQYYYSWKISDRYELFSQSRLGRRKLINQTSVECEFDMQESESPVGLQESAFSEGLHVNAEAGTDGIMNNSHYNTCSCKKDQCSCRISPLSGPIHEDQQDTPPITSDLISLEVPPPALPLLSGLKGQDSPLASFSVADLGVLSLPDFLSPPSLLCSTSHPP